MGPTDDMCAEALQPSGHDYDSIIEALHPSGLDIKYTTKTNESSMTRRWRLPPRHVDI